jgi:hypothetical protein
MTAIFIFRVSGGEDGAELSDPQGVSVLHEPDGMLTLAIRAGAPVDAENRSALMCVYTGKEVVECKVQMAVVEVAKDQVRWLRLRAVALSGVPLQVAGSGGTTVRTLPVS